MAPSITSLNSSNADLENKSDDGIVNVDGSFFEVAGSLDTHTATVNWGDSPATESLTVNQLADTFSGGHTYGTGGTPWSTVIDKKGIVRFNDFTPKSVDTLTDLIDQLRQGN